jgi:hypothetical protein
VKTIIRKMTEFRLHMRLRKLLLQDFHHQWKFSILVLVLSFSYVNYVFLLAYVLLIDLCNSYAVITWRVLYDHI